MNDKLAQFVRKKRVIRDTTPIGIKEVKIPWYLRPIKREAFTVRVGKDKKFYAQHNEWSKRIWIGPYSSQKAVDNIIESYVTESLKGSLERKQSDSIHSIVIENEKEFF